MIFQEERKQKERQDLLPYLWSLLAFQLLRRHGNFYLVTTFSDILRDSRDSRSGIRSGLVKSINTGVFL